MSGFIEKAAAFSFLHCLLWCVLNELFKGKFGPKWMDSLKRSMLIVFFQIIVGILCDSARSSEDCFLKASFDVKSELTVT